MKKITVPGTADEAEEVQGVVLVFGSLADHPYSVCVALAGRYAQLTVHDARNLALALLKAADWAVANSARDGVWLSRQGGKDLSEFGLGDVRRLRFD